MSNENTTPNEVTAPVATEATRAEPTNVVYRDPARNPQAAPVAPIATSYNGLEARKKRSFLKSDKTRYAGSISYDDETFYYNPLSGEMLERVEGIADELSSALNLTVNEMMARKYYSREETAVMREIQTQLWEDVIADSLVSWTLNETCNAANQKDLHVNDKRRVAESVIAFSQGSETEARFRQ